MGGLPKKATTGGIPNKGLVPNSMPILGAPRPMMPKAPKMPKPTKSLLGKSIGGNSYL
jgi:hypothetical protein